MPEKIIKIKTNQRIDLNKFVAKLISFGYERVVEVEEYGQFAPRGGYIIIWPVNSQNKIIIELFGNDINSITIIDNENNRLDKLLEFELSSNVLKLFDGKKVIPGSYIVHIDHGIGIYKTKGLKIIDKVSNPYVFIEYLNNDFLYLPYEQIDKLTSYIGVGRRTPRLSKLGSATWQRTKQRAYDNVILLAKELLNIYAKREIVIRKPYEVDNNWDNEIQKTFGFSETTDQDKAINETYSDLKKNSPMDRLICGDVGFGKTEVAIRAIVQAVANGHQAALLCPTTILAEQHYAVLERRLKNLPVKIEVLSRFRAAAKQKEIIERLRSGKTDIIIGTHRLLSKDVNFQNLDLVVIDEEQRFGVKQKEQFKKMREKINILSLSATPIPRTLFMALSGIRDISEINTPPKGRLGIETEISQDDPDKIASYLKRELERGGQSYVLFNHVDRIFAFAEKIRKLVPKAQIGVAHGQLSEMELSNTMSKFILGELDILICSTIIENGLDIASVNTLVVIDSENFGLSQLYQIRGRIGRGKNQAYSLLLHSGKILPENAYKRLSALAENTELGSGYNIALSDLEIRGGGNILGREQHGAMEAVGLILYSKLLRQAVKKISQ